MEEVLERCPCVLKNRANTFGGLINIEFPGSLRGGLESLFVLFERDLVFLKEYGKRLLNLYISTCWPVDLLQ